MSLFLMLVQNNIHKCNLSDIKHVGHFQITSNLSTDNKYMIFYEQNFLLLFKILKKKTKIFIKLRRIL